MKIKATSHGGLAGRTGCVELDTACAANGKAVEDLLHQVDFFGATPALGVGADIPRWDITVDDGPRRRTVTVLEDGASGGPGWQKLLEHLRNTA
jgi:hypothetical protein